MSARDTSGSAPQHSHPHNNTMSRNEKFWVDQVAPPPPSGNDKGWGTTRGGGGTSFTALTDHLLFLAQPLSMHIVKVVLATNSMSSLQCTAEQSIAHYPSKYSPQPLSTGTGWGQGGRRVQRFARRAPGAATFVRYGTVAVVGQSLEKAATNPYR